MRVVSLARLSFVRFVVVCALAGCVTAKTTGNRDRGSDAVITQAQLAATNSDNLYDAVYKLHPEWFNSRGPSSSTTLEQTWVSVYMGGTQLGRADAMTQIRMSEVTEVRFWNAGQASAKFGMGHPRGVIELIRK